MSQNTWNLIRRAAILVPFLIAVFAVGYLFAGFKNRRFNESEC